GVEIWLKRDDLTGLGLSGNKVRKLDFLLADAQQQQATAIITCGGIQSNHCRATAVACRQLGLRPVLVLRGTPPSGQHLDGNLLLNAMLGAEVRWITPDDYRHRRAAIMEELAAELRSRGERPYIVPEGGSNAVGAMGFVRAGQELSTQLTGLGLDVDAVICATGSGGTLAGLAMSGLRAEVVGVAVCDDRAYFRKIVEDIAAIAEERFNLSLPDTGWDVLEGYQGRGYGLSRPEELRDQATMAEQEGIFLDPVYTGKAWHAISEMVRQDRRALGERVVLWHTGGLFGAFGRGADYHAALAVPFVEE
ncbi:MAG: pyridoxal-phosphate dependent enzyme, partial [Myxococcota bacterium]